jgi:hypothetical protein
MVLLELEATDVILRPNDYVTLALEPLCDDRLAEHTAQLEECLHSIDDRTPGTLRDYEDVETTLARVMSIHNRASVLLESLNQSVFDPDQSIEIRCSGHGQLNYELALTHLEL